MDREFHLRGILNAEVHRSLLRNAGNCRRGVGWLRRLEDVRKRVGANRLPINFFGRYGRAGATRCGGWVNPCDRPSRIWH